jgi:hypothetical protein
VKNLPRGARRRRDDGTVAIEVGSSSAGAIDRWMLRPEVQVQVLTRKCKWTSFVQVQARGRADDFSRAW